MIKMNSKTFSQEIETAVKKEKLSYMDAIIPVSYTHLRAHET